jgi:hypothetical protein
VTNSLSDYYKCPLQYESFVRGGQSEAKGYFRFGEDVVCYGKSCGPRTSSSFTDTLQDALPMATAENGKTFVPFDLSEVIDNLRNEFYTGNWRKGYAKSLLVKMYYWMRPLLSLSLRSYVKKFHLRGWDELPFPRWPVDCSVDNLLGQILLLSLRSTGSRRIPFIWFWPEGSPSCAVMTHDVETESGQKLCPELMDIDDSFRIKASFQIVPEGCYKVSPEFLASIRERGFEVLVHDLNHDGHLYRNREEFLRRAARIDAYREEYGAKGFRSAVLYRNQKWFDAYKFSYDMSVPNVAHLDPQRGGCCTVMPYFIGNMVELPVTTTQDYMLFHLLDDYSTKLWKEQIDIIMKKAGLISFIVHPDYTMKPRQRIVYQELLTHLADLREKQNLWITTPGEVDCWWRQRAEMTLVEEGDSLRIEGVGSERARIAYASEEDGRLVFTVQPAGSETRRTAHITGPELAPVLALTDRDRSPW